MVMEQRGHKIYVANTVTDVPTALFEEAYVSNMVRRRIIIKKLCSVCIVLLYESGLEGRCVCSSWGQGGILKGGGMWEAGSVWRVVLG